VSRQRLFGVTPSRGSQFEKEIGQANAAHRGRGGVGSHRGDPAAFGARIVCVLLLPSRASPRFPPVCGSFLGDVVPCALGPQQDHEVGVAGAGAIGAAVFVVGSSLAGRAPEGDPARCRVQFRASKGGDRRSTGALEIAIWAEVIARRTPIHSDYGTGARRRVPSNSSRTNRRSDSDIARRKL
jgi:hypothetical protein